jgi:uncharacterized protein YkwD
MKKLIILALAAGFFWAIMQAIPYHEHPDPSWVGDYPHSMDEDTRKLEELIFMETNEVRASYGLQKLEADPHLTDLARRHSLDMVQRQYFSHYNPEGDGPTGRAKKLGYPTIRFYGFEYSIGVGENIALTPTGNVIGHGQIKTSQDIAKAAVKNWMNSPPHRENTLNPNYKIMGVGAAKDENNTHYITKNLQ